MMGKQQRIPGAIRSGGYKVENMTPGKGKSIIYIIYI